MRNFINTCFIHITLDFSQFQKKVVTCVLHFLSPVMYVLVCIPPYVSVCHAVVN